MTKDFGGSAGGGGWVWRGGWARDVGVMGVWHSKDGAKIEVHSCGSEVCVKLVKLSDDATGHERCAIIRIKSLRQRPLVGLEIGQGFRLADAAHAEDGKLYDPKSGKTYHGTMTSDGDALNLRGLCWDQGVWAVRDVDAG